LGAEDEPLTLAGAGGQEVTDDLLRMAVGVDVRGVDQVAAAVEVLGQDGFGRLRAGAPAAVLAEGHSAQRERADAQAGTAERAVRIQSGHASSTPAAGRQALDRS